MSDEALYARYKDALRTGHVAAVRGRLDAALAAYGEAATLAPDRPLPHTSMGRILLRLGRTDDALAAFAAALRHGPRDEGALAGRADALAEAGRPAEAAGVLDLLADVQEAADRIPDACDTARHALELAESRARRRHLEALVAQLQTSSADRGGEVQLGRALRFLDAPVVVPDAGRLDAAAESAPGVEGGPAEGAAPGVEGGPAEGAAPGVEGGPAEGAALEEEPTADIDAVGTAVETALASGDPIEVHDAILGAVASLRRAGLLDAAVDACQLALTVAPADPDIHLALAELDLDHGWTVVAADKLAILGRFVELTGDAAARDRLCALVGARLPDDPRLAAICA